MNRKRLYAAVILMGEVGMILVLWVKAYWQLLVLRALTGIGKFSRKSARCEVRLRRKCARGLTSENFLQLSAARCHLSCR